MKYSLLDTNAVSAILKNDEFGIHLCERGVKEDWLFMFHPGVAAELAQLKGEHKGIMSLFPLSDEKLRNFDELIWRDNQRIKPSDFYRFLEKGRFGVVKSPSEILAEEISNYQQPSPILPYKCIEERFVFDDQNDFERLAVEARAWSAIAKAEAATKHSKMVAQSIEDRNRIGKVSKHGLERLSKIHVRAALADHGFRLATNADCSRFPSSQVGFFAVWYKYLEGNREATTNDQFDLLLFYILPYINVFVTENSNAEIVKKIKGFKLLDDLEVVRVSHTLS